MNRRQRDDEVTLGKTVGVENKWGMLLPEMEHTETRLRRGPEVTRASLQLASGSNRCRELAHSCKGGLPDCWTGRVWALGQVL